MTRMTDEERCSELHGGRRCQRKADHKQRHHFDGIEGKNCTCILRWHPNRCEAHPECNQ